MPILAKIQPVSELIHRFQKQQHIFYKVSFQVSSCYVYCIFSEFIYSQCWTQANQTTECRKCICHFQKHSFFLVFYLVTGNESKIVRLFNFQPNYVPDTGQKLMSLVQIFVKFVSSEQIPSNSIFSGFVFLKLGMTGFFCKILFLKKLRKFYFLAVTKSSSNLGSSHSSKINKQRY